jgi:SAM-dependent methyltransferase
VLKDITVSDLHIMSRAHNYRRWLFESVSGHLGRRVLEVGSGIGNYTEYLLNSEQVVCVEIHADAVAELSDRFDGHKNIHIHHGDAQDPAFLKLARFKCDSAICFNVLEHIPDDKLALTHMRKVLVPGGKALLIVPALQWVYGTIDRQLDHYRRYNKKSMRALVEGAGLEVESLRWMNLPGVAGWFLNNRILQRTEESPGQILFYDRFIVPWLRRFEQVIPPPVGLSLVCVARVPKA